MLRHKKIFTVLLYDSVTSITQDLLLEQLYHRHSQSMLNKRSWEQTWCSTNLQNKEKLKVFLKNICYLLSTLHYSYYHISSTF